jgi:hypothetical protein
MGWVYGFHSLDPTIVKDVLSISPAELVARLKAKGISPENAGCESWDDGVDENSALTLLATTREWDVDKDLENIDQIAGLAPALIAIKKLLREMEDFRASGLPGRFHPTEVGLMGIAMPATISAALVAAEAYAKPEGRQLLAKPSSWLNGLSTGSVRKRIASDDHLWKHWTDLVEAMRWAHTRSEWLGLHMS